MLDFISRFLPFIIGGFLSGSLCGCLPWLLARNHGRPWLGFAALTTCAASGVILGVILALPIAASFSTAILLSEKRDPRRKANRPAPITTDSTAAAELSESRDPVQV